MKARRRGVGAPGIDSSLFLWSDATNLLLEIERENAFTMFLYACITVRLTFSPFLFFFLFRIGLLMRFCQGQDKTSN